MDLETIKLNVLNIFALSLQMMQVERILAFAVGITALIYNVMKIYSWVQKRVEERKNL
jgi:uncharacterized membrane protein YecN with MAPEG domain